MSQIDRKAPSGNTWRLMKRASLSISLSVLITVAASSIFAVSASMDKGLSAAQLTLILKEKEKKVGSETSRVIGNGPNITVMAQTKPGAADQDLKIDAVFLAKTLVDSAPDQIERVEVIFSGSGPEGRFLKVSKKEILDYGQGNMSPETFLSTLHLTPVNAEELPTVVAGPQKERRLLIVDRIEKLRAAGTGVKPFETIFQSIETAIKSGDTENLSGKISDLENKLKEQEEQVAIAKRTAMGGGLKPVPNKSWSLSPQIKKTDLPPVLNKDFSQVRKNFSEKAEFAIQRMSQINPTGAGHMRDLKRRIDEKIATGKTDDAHPLIEEFWKTVDQDNPQAGKYLRGQEGPNNKQGPPHRPGQNFTSNQH